MGKSTPLRQIKRTHEPEGAVVHDGRIGNLKRFKEDVGEVREGYECGISIENFNDVKVGDTIECYEIEEVARTLESAS